jgi:hypothetical protein
MATHVKKCSVTVLASKLVVKGLINLNRTELHIDGIVYNIFSWKNQFSIAVLIIYTAFLFRVEV